MRRLLIESIRMVKFEELPEECIVAVLCRTTSVDAGRFSVVSKIFRSVADFDAVWNHFLPSNPLPNFPTKKALYLTISDRPIIINHGKKSFQLDRKSGKKCYMLAAISLSINWGDTEPHWSWISMHDSRFPEVAELRAVLWLEIRGRINNLVLSPNTQYAAYLVFKMINARGFQNCPVELSVGVEGGHSITNIVCLDSNVEGRWHNRVVGLQNPSVRRDGWLEIEMGEFFNSGLEDEEVQMSVMNTKGDEGKTGLFLEGIEVRPKEGN